MLTVSLMGILNVTPDSFSDGGVHTSKGKALDHANGLIADGAEIIDIGGDSTRPGSVCVGVEEEWKRIKDLIAPLAKLTKVSIDTHQAEVARRALLEGASYINDVSGAIDPQMLPTVANSSASLILMHSATGTPHRFLEKGKVVDDVVNDVKTKFLSFIDNASSFGISHKRLFLDTGMGGFISNEPKDSIAIIRQYRSLSAFGCGLVFGCSRKGFLRSSGEKDVKERDAASTLCAIAAIADVDGDGSVILRVHNVAMHKRALNVFKVL